MKSVYRLHTINATLLILISFINFSQTGPAGIGTPSTNELWLQVESSCYTDAGVTSGTNGSFIYRWSDRSGNNKHAQQTITGFRPVLQTNQLNGFSTLRFDGSDDRILSTGVTSNNQLSIFVVVKFNSLINNNDGIIQAGPAGTAFTTSASDKSVGMWVQTSTNKLWGRGVQTNNSSRNIPVSSAISTNQFYIFTQEFNGTGINQYINGTTQGSVTYDNSLKSWSDFGIGRQASESANADFAEVILHRVYANQAQRIITENYLAAKYGLLLTTNDLYDEDNVGNGNYDYEVAGIGQIDAVNSHNDAQGTGIVRILNPSGLNNNEFFIWGHNNGIQQATNTTDVPTPVEARFDRVWRVSEVNTSGTAVDVGSIEMRFDLNGLASITASDLCLLIDTDNDGVFIDEAPIFGAVDLGGNIYQFLNVTGIVNNSRFTLGTISSNQTPLPITLVYFNATPINKRTVRIDWQTIAEVNNDYFTIEKSQDLIDWQEMIIIDGAGQSNQILNYSEIDEYPFRGHSYYRLKQTDFDGKHFYSNIKPVTLDADFKNNLLVFPNPADDELIIFGESKELGHIKIENLLGQDVSFEITVIIANEQQITLDISNLKPGTYFVKTASFTKEIRVY